MVESLNPYEVLGVAPDAGDDAIRTAYIDLMKRYHPDRGGGEAARKRASEINRAFSMLKSPVARSRFAFEREQAAFGGRGRLVPAFDAPQVRRPRGKLIGGMLIIAACGAVLAILSRNPAPLETARPARLALAPQIENSAASADLPRPRASNIEDAVSNYVIVRAGWGSDGVAQFGRQCFSEFESNPSFSMLDYCFAFDTVAALSGAPRDQFGGYDPYFNTPSRDRRYAAGFRLLGRSAPENDMRRRELELLTISAVDRHFRTGLRAGQRPQPPR